MQQQLISKDYIQMAPMPNNKNANINKIFGKIDNIITESQFNQLHIPINIKDENGDSILHHILRNSLNEEEALRKIIVIPNIKSLINVVDSKGRSPMHLICKYQYYNVFKFIVNDEYDLNEDQRIILNMFNNKTLTEDVIDSINNFINNTQNLMKNKPEELKIPDNNYKYVYECYNQFYNLYNKINNYIIKYINKKNKADVNLEYILYIILYAIDNYSYITFETFKKIDNKQIFNDNKQINNVKMRHFIEALVLLRYDIFILKENYNSIINNDDIIDRGNRPIIKTKENSFIGGSEDDESEDDYMINKISHLVNINIRFIITCMNKIINTLLKNLNKNKEILKKIIQRIEKKKGIKIKDILNKLDNLFNDSEQYYYKKSSIDKVSFLWRFTHNLSIIKYRDDKITEDFEKKYKYTWYYMNFDVRLKNYDKLKDYVDKLKDYVDKLKDDVKLKDVDNLKDYVDKLKVDVKLKDYVYNLKYYVDKLKVDDKLKDYVDNLKDCVDKLKDDVKLKDYIVKLKDYVDKLKDDVKLKDYVDNLKDYVDKLKDDVDNLKDYNNKTENYYNKLKDYNDNHLEEKILIDDEEIDNIKPHNNINNINYLIFDYKQKTPLNYLLHGVINNKSMVKIDKSSIDDEDNEYDNIVYNNIIKDYIHITIDNNNINIRFINTDFINDYINIIKNKIHLLYNTFVDNRRLEYFIGVDNRNENNENLEYYIKNNKYRFINKSNDIMNNIRIYLFKQLNDNILKKYLNKDDKNVINNNILMYNIYVLFLNKIGIKNNIYFKVCKEQDITVKDIKDTNIKNDIQKEIDDINKIKDIKDIKDINKVINVIKNITSSDFEDINNEQTKNKISNIIQDFKNIKDIENINDDQIKNKIIKIIKDKIIKNINNKFINIFKSKINNKIKSIINNIVDNELLKLYEDKKPLIIKALSSIN